jgi:hypothetical protein
LGDPSWVIHAIAVIPACRLARRGAPPLREIYKIDYQGSPVQDTYEQEVIEAEAVEFKA